MSRPRFTTKQEARRVHILNSRNQRVDTRFGLYCMLFMSGHVLGDTCWLPGSWARGRTRAPSGQCRWASSSRSSACTPRTSPRPRRGASVLNCPWGWSPFFCVLCRYYRSCPELMTHVPPLLFRGGTKHNASYVIFHNKSLLFTNVPTARDNRQAILLILLESTIF